MSSRSYWERRKAKDMFHYMEQAETVANEISIVYLNASRYLGQEMADIFERFRKKHKLSETEARRLLNLMQDRTSVDELKTVLRSEQGDETKTALLAELESPAYQARLERLQQTQNQLDMVMQQVYQQEKTQNRNLYHDLGQEVYYRS